MSRRSGPGSPNRTCANASGPASLSSFSTGWSGHENAPADTGPGRRRGGLPKKRDQKGSPVCVPDDQGQSRIVITAKVTSGQHHCPDLHILSAKVREFSSSSSKGSKSEQMPAIAPEQAARVGSTPRGRSGGCFGRARSAGLHGRFSFGISAACSNTAGGPGSAPDDDLTKLCIYNSLFIMRSRR